MDQGKSLREHIVWLLQNEHAHATFDKAVANIPVDDRGAKPPGIPHSPWRLIEHLRICQWDVLEFVRNVDHVSPDFPDGYWPTTDGPGDPGDWDRSIEAFRSDLNAMIGLALDKAVDLFAPISHGQGQTVLREILLIADHNAYHIGQLVAIRRALGCWVD